MTKMHSKIAEQFSAAGLCWEIPFCTSGNPFDLDFDDVLKVPITPSFVDDLLAVITSHNAVSLNHKLAVARGAS